MKYLRGSNKSKIILAKSVKPGLQEQITDLKRQVGGNKPEIQYFRADGTIISSGGGNEQTNISVSEFFQASSSFRNNITGDRWQNLNLDLRFYLSTDNQLFRYIVYVPKRSGTRFNPTTNPFVRIPDPTAFWVLKDETVSRENTTSVSTGLQSVIAKRINLRRMITQFNSDSGIFEKNEIVIAVLTNGVSTTAAEQVQYSWMLTYNNK